MTASVTASVTASLLRGSLVAIHHSSLEGLCRAFRDAKNVKDADNTSRVYYFYLPSPRGVFPDVRTLLDCPVSLLDNPLVSVRALSGGIVIV